MLDVNAWKGVCPLPDLGTKGIPDLGRAGTILFLCRFRVSKLPECFFLVSCIATSLF